MTDSVIAVTAVSSFGITVLLGFILIPMLKKLHFGQTIREDGPIWHKSKENTPTMGGLIFIAAVCLSTILGLVVVMTGENSSVSGLEAAKLFAGLAMALLFGAIGFIDDYISVIKKRNLGLTAMQKIIFQAIITAAYLTVMYFLNGKSTDVFIPFIGQIDFHILYFPIMGLLIIGFVNAVNITDGVDGLCTTLTFVAAAAFMIISSQLAFVGENILSTALAASCVGFLVYNLHPAKVFMGDTGSFFLGGTVIALAFGMEMELVLLFIGFVYCCEALSVILQVLSVKIRGKRIFKMSPIHHHFELCGWSENKIVGVFALVAAVMSAIGYIAVYSFFLS